MSEIDLDTARDKDWWIAEYQKRERQLTAEKEAANAYIKQLENGDAYRKIEEELEALRKETDQLRVQLAGCGVAAMCNTEKSMAQQRVNKGDYGWSQSYEDVITAVQREIALRKERDGLRAGGYILAGNDALATERDSCANNMCEFYSPAAYQKCGGETAGEPSIASCTRWKRPYPAVLYRTEQSYQDMKHRAEAAEKERDELRLEVGTPIPKTVKYRHMEQHITNLQSRLAAYEETLMVIANFSYHSTGQEAASLAKETLSGHNS